MALAKLKDLYVEELKDLYSAENQLMEALPKMSAAAHSKELKSCFDEHLKQTEGHIERLKQIFEGLGEKPTGKTCKAMKGLVAEGSEMIAEDAAPAVKDAGLISSAQRVEHYEMAGYGSVHTYAEELGETEASKLLQQTLKEEKATDKLLSTVAVNVINIKAKQ